MNTLTDAYAFAKGVYEVLRASAVADYLYYSSGRDIIAEKAHPSGVRHLFIYVADQMVQVTVTDNHPYNTMASTVVIASPRQVIAVATSIMDLLTSWPPMVAGLPSDDVRRRRASNLFSVLAAARLSVDVDAGITCDGNFTVTVNDIRCHVTDQDVEICFPDPYGDPHSSDPNSEAFVTVRVAPSYLYTAVATVVEGLLTVLYPNPTNPANPSNPAISVVSTLDTAAIAGPCAGEVTQ